MEELFIAYLSAALILYLTLIHSAKTAKHYPY